MLQVKMARNLSPMNLNCCCSGLRISLDARTLRTAVHIVLLLCMVGNVASQARTTRMVVTSPVNPVKQGDIFSVHCQVWNLKPGNEVAIFKNESGIRNIRLSVNNVLTPNVDGGEDAESMFLAVRQLPDGSVVYFLSIINVALSDGGMYTCKVIDTSQTLAEVAVDSVVLKVMHHPDDNYPVCSQSATTLVAGSKVELTCKTEETFPPVDIKWSRTGAGFVHLPSPTLSTTPDGMIVSTIDYIPLESDDKSSLFLCEITSKSFPEYVKTCHIGPLKILPNPAGGRTSNGNEETLPKTSSPNIDNIPKVPDLIPMTPVTAPYECPKKLCSTMSTDVLFWVISTTIAGLICLIFLIACLFIYFKYTRLNAEAKEREQTRPFPRHPTEYIYTELEGKREGKYMSLERPTGLPIHPIRQVNIQEMR